MNKTDELHKAILNNVPDQAWLKDRESRYILVNDAFIADCGLPEQEILNKTPPEVWPQEWGKQYIETDREVIRSGLRLRYEERRPGKDGSLHWFDTIKTPIRNEQGEIIGTAGISRDISDRKQAEQELLESRSQLRELSAYLQSVREEERTRIARELHDELGQSLTAIRIGLGVMETRREMQQDEWFQNIQSLKELADSTVEAVQRIAADLRPSLLDELGLTAAIDWMLESFSSRTGIRYEALLPPAPLDFSSEVSTAIFRILQEALTNVSRHSQASLVEVELKEADDMIVLKITDNGKGMAYSEGGGKSLGLLGMRERAYMLGGSLHIQSRIGAGTSIELRIPKFPLNREKS